MHTETNPYTASPEFPWTGPHLGPALWEGKPLDKLDPKERARAREVLATSGLLSETERAWAMRLIDASGPMAGELEP